MQFDWARFFFLYLLHACTLHTMSQWCSQSGSVSATPPKGIALLTLVDSKGWGKPENPSPVDGRRIDGEEVLGHNDPRTPYDSPTRHSEYGQMCSDENLKARVRQPVAACLMDVSLSWHRYFVSRPAGLWLYVPDIFREGHGRGGGEFYCGWGRGIVAHWFGRVQGCACRCYAMSRWVLHCLRQSHQVAFWLIHSIGS